MTARRAAAAGLQAAADRLDPEGSPPAVSDPAGSLDQTWEIARKLGDVELKESASSNWNEDGNCSAEIGFKNGTSLVWARHKAATVGEALAGAINEAQRLGAVPTKK